MARDLILSEMDRIRKEMNNLFKHFLSLPERRNIGKPLMRISGERPEIIDKGKEIVARVKLPGVEMKDIHLKVMPQSVELKAQHTEETKTEKKGLFRQESSYKGFHRIFPLPVKVLADKSKTLYQKGVLEIHMPKARLEKPVKKLQLK